ncbi:MAG: hypothetical protein H3C64_05485 [Candidatus Kuenenia stuttgartiensis]|uniref:hypothetical protein n=1 Tax=Kuenenia stuttgartiensis TaxID=174633 RepID=UPI0012FEB0F1|nr:hypothetical protein [Candidatus Kuenenia stuttgartiensis]MBW7941852.1 hypothetical protein [Candidatus Kuenenia stuttgartiensis]MBZ0190565.1 hypothetical protein [Candidatus Kuenenia stuttgartiensis]MCL4728425.1 hypothetical protein [Candidatus Kuenenia stuttgartiensis]
MKTIIIASCLLVAGCTSTVSQTEQQYYDVYDEQGKRKGYISKVSESVIFFLSFPANSLSFGL